MARPKRIKTNAEARARDYVRYLRREHHLPVTQAYLFGSHAKGLARRWSDIDICILSPAFQRRDALSYLWQRRRDVDVEHGIAPVGYDPKEFKRDSLSPLIWEIQKTGKRLTI